MDRRRVLTLTGLAAAVALCVLLGERCSDPPRQTVSASPPRAETPPDAARRTDEPAPGIVRSPLQDGAAGAVTDDVFLVRVVGGVESELLSGADVGAKGQQYAWGTDASGVVRLASDLLAHPTWFVWHDEWMPWEGVLPEPGADGVREIRLTAGGEIRGRLIGPTIAEEWRALRVRVWPDARNAEEHWFPNAKGERWMNRIVPVAADGSFRVRGLLPDCVYGVTAGGGGNASPQPARFVAPDGALVELAVLPLWGVSLSFRTEHGSIPSGHPSLFTYQSVGCSMPRAPRGAVSRFTEAHPAAGICGISIPSERSRGAHDSLLIFLGDFDAPLTVDAHASLAGYLPWSGEVPLARLRSELPSHVVTLAAQRGVRWGKLRVDIAGLPKEVRADSLCGVTVLNFWPLDFATPEERLPLAMRLPAPQGGGLIVEGIPCGRYALDLTPLHEFGLWYRHGPPMDRLAQVVVSEAGMAEARVDWSGRGHVHFRGPRPYPVMIRRAGSGRGPETSLHGGGSDWAFFPGLAPGNYEYAAVPAQRRDGAPIEWVPFDVFPDAWRGIDPRAGSR